MSGAAESLLYGPRYDSSYVYAKEWNIKRRALKAIHKMYLEDIETDSLDDCVPMSFPELVQAEMSNIHVIPQYPKELLS